MVLGKWDLESEGEYVVLIFGVTGGRSWQSGYLGVERVG
jgi:hypothetical protein